MLLAVRQLVRGADDELRAGVCEAVVELLLGQPPRERHEHGSHPLRGPVEKGGLEPVIEHGRHPVAGLDAEAAGDPANPRQELPVRKPRKGLELGVPLACRLQRTREVHARAASSIASTIGA